MPDTPPRGSQRGDDNLTHYSTTPLQTPRQFAISQLQQDRPDPSRGSEPPPPTERAFTSPKPQRADSEPNDPQKTPERVVKSQIFAQAANVNGQDTPGSSEEQLAEFDWEDFEARYRRALEEADENEQDVLREAEELSKYFRAWASAASLQDNERAVKRLQTRQRFVNISEEKMAQKQQHYNEVVKAFESALALLRSQT